MSTVLFVLSSVTFCLQPVPASKPAKPPPRPIKVKTVGDEYTHVSRQRCKCGGKWKVDSQSLASEDGRKLDLLECSCIKCGSKKAFRFDVSAWMEGLKYQSSGSARVKVYAELDRKYPTIDERFIPELIALLDSDDPHRKSWAAAALIKVPTDETCDALVIRYGAAMSKMDITFSTSGRDALRRIGARVVPHIIKALPSADRQGRFDLILLLGDFKETLARKAVMAELRHADRYLARACYLALAKQGFKESESVLLAALDNASDAPDDALIWAVGCCGTKNSFAKLRLLADGSADKNRCAAIAALGIVGDRESTHRLLEIAEKGPTNDRHNAIYALGCLRTDEAVPLLLRTLEERTSSRGSFPMPLGMYDESLMVHSVSDMRPVCVIALGMIGDVRAVPALKNLLHGENGMQVVSEVARAAGTAGWKSLVPDVIAAFRKYQDWLSQYNSDPQLVERVSPWLRKLTGATIGEDAKAWEAWLKK